MYPKIQSIFKARDWPGTYITFVNKFLENYQHIKKDSTSHLIHINLITLGK